MDKSATIPGSLIAYCLYLAVAPFLVSAALINDNRAFERASTISSPATVLILPIFILFLIYWVRLFCLLLPVKLLDKKWHIMTTLGVALAIIPELIVVIWSFSMFGSKSATCSDFGGGCGTGALIFFPIIAATFLQFIGMGIGALIAYFKK